MERDELWEKLGLILAELTGTFYRALDEAQAKIYDLITETDEGEGEEPDDVD
jgi:hypothetical protein